VSAFADASAAVRRSRACTHVALRCAAGAALWKVAGMSGVQIGPARAGGTCQVSARYRIILHALCAPGATALTRMLFCSTSGDCARLYVNDTLRRSRDATSARGDCRAQVRRRMRALHALLAGRVRTARPWRRCSRSCWGCPARGARYACRICVTLRYLRFRYGAAHLVGVDGRGVDDAPALLQVRQRRLGDVDCRRRRRHVSTHACFDASCDALAPPCLHMEKTLVANVSLSCLALISVMD
jgi:hypothetical protein